MYCEFLADSFQEVKRFFKSESKVPIISEIQIGSEFLFANLNRAKRQGIEM
jgi:hypothetical protein